MNDMLTCPACGRENRSEADYCAWCGYGFDQGRPTIKLPILEVMQAAAKPEPEPKLNTDAGPSAHEKDPARGQDADRVEPARSANSAAGSASTAEASTATSHLKPGDILAGRYEIISAEIESVGSSVYRAKDLRLCSTCGYEMNAIGEPFCSECGASLQTHPMASIVEQVRRAPAEYDAHLADGEKDYYITAEEAPQQSVGHDEGTPRQLRLVWGEATDSGQSYDHNEDYEQAWVYQRTHGEALGLFVVCDGLGGQDSGEVASRMATETVWESLRESVWEPVQRGASPTVEELTASVDRAISLANSQVYAARTARASEMSTTVTLALLHGADAVVGNVGDSRTYLWDAGGLRRITTDHSLVQRLVDSGEIAPEEVYSHPQRNLIYQCIGDRPDVVVDTVHLTLTPDDRLILCSDGLWEMVRDEGIEEALLAEQDPQRACDLLVRNANLAGGEDNISVILVHARVAPTRQR